jgi:hypothetical protein
MGSRQLHENAPNIGRYADIQAGMSSELQTTRSGRFMHQGIEHAQELAES